jgi:hypothetical protein
MVVGEVMTLWKIRAICRDIDLLRIAHGHTSEDKRLTVQHSELAQHAELVETVPVLYDLTHF